MPIALYVDAKSVYAAVTATFVKVPAEKSLLCHIQYLRELLDQQILQSLVWLDTRDMGADGLTKGAVLRTQLHMLMNGYMKIEHPCESWQSKSISVKQSRSNHVDDNHTYFAPSFFCLHSAPAPSASLHPELSTSSVPTLPPFDLTMAAPAMRAPEHGSWKPATSQDVILERVVAAGGDTMSAAANSEDDLRGDRQVEPTAAPPGAPPEVFAWHQKVYPKKVNPQVNATWSINIIQH